MSYSVLCHAVFSFYVIYVCCFNFQATINDIQQQMNENYEKNNKLRIENMELANKLKNLIEQYELREQVCLCM